MTISTPFPAGTEPTHAHVEQVNPTGVGVLVLVCEHATHRIPEDFAGLGLDGDVLTSHIAWDLGAMEVATLLSSAFDAPLIAPVVSRLVYDCNRPSRAQSAVPETSEHHAIPGNSCLSDADRQHRAANYYLPYRTALIEALDAAVAKGLAPTLVTLHSFTPVYEGARREMDIGILHDTDDRLANEILSIAKAEGNLIVRRNAPYSPSDGVTYTLAEHAVPRQLLNVMIEIRNDLIATEADRRAMSQTLTRWLETALTNLSTDMPREASS